MGNKSVWLITAKTNLHVGNENTSNYGLVDKLIQRDALTGLPCINSSSLKGALNEFFTEKENKNEAFLKEVFGADKKKRIDGSQKGSHLFFDAQILLLPVQDESNYFHWVTTKSILLAFIERIKLVGLDYNGTPEELLNILKLYFAKGYEVEVIENQKFIEYCDDDNLPIIARNKLDNGESANLWYEQILPQETIFYTMILEQGKHTLDLNNKIIQIGANATIGYGCCKFSNVEFENS